MSCYFEGQSPACFHGCIFVSWTLHFFCNQWIVGRVTYDCDPSVIFGCCSQKSYASYRKKKGGDYFTQILFKCNLIFYNKMQRALSANLTNINLLHSILHCYTRVSNCLHKRIKVAHHHSYKNQKWNKMKDFMKIVWKWMTAQIPDDSHIYRRM